MSDEESKKVNEPRIAVTGEMSEAEAVKNEENEEEEEEIVGLSEVIQADEEARRVLAPSDVNVCTYAEGYKPRQALYSCRTCVPDGSAGICLGCSLNCHDGHDLVELYTKRRFKCDCGNASFKDKCKLFEEKAPRNERNTYNGNFVNEYCSCKRPYPDPEGLCADDMMQCVVCEDWIHTSHSGLSQDQYEEAGQHEFACKACAERLPFLAKCPKEGEPISCSNEKREEGEAISAVVMYAGWRERLCACAKCEDLYDRLGCDWIHDQDDSLDTYNEMADKIIAEEDAKQELAMRKMLGTHDRDVVTQVMNGVKDMKRKMVEMVNRMGEGNQVITSEHIHNLFDELRREKREEFNRRMEALSEGRVEEERHEDGEH